MSALRKRIRHRHAILLTLLLTGAVLLDTTRSPATQATARLYVAVVRGYQALGRPLVKGYVQCRYHPCCSEYSIEAVERYGIWKGLRLTISRLCRCRSRVPFGTYDPVQPATGDSCEAERLCQAQTSLTPESRADGP